MAITLLQWFISYCYSICSLESELKKFRVQFEETVDAHEAEVKSLNNQITDLNRQREAALREVAELKTQLKMTEETRDSIRRDLIEANRKIREGELELNVVIWSYSLFVHILI